MFCHFHNLCSIFRVRYLAFDILSIRIGSAATATGSFLLGTAGVHQITMKFSQHYIILPEAGK